MFVISAEDGCIIAECPALSGCISQAKAALLNSFQDNSHSPVCEIARYIVRCKVDFIAPWYETIGYFKLIKEIGIFEFFKHPVKITEPFRLNHPKNEPQRLIRHIVIRKNPPLGEWLYFIRLLMNTAFIPIAQ